MNAKLLKPIASRMTNFGEILNQIMHCLNSIKHFFLTVIEREAISGFCIRRLLVAIVVL
jgi:hypothetical protein